MDYHPTGSSQGSDYTGHDEVRRDLNVSHFGHEDNSRHFHSRMSQGSHHNSFLKNNNSSGHNPQNHFVEHIDGNVLQEEHLNRLSNLHKNDVYSPKF